MAAAALSFPSQRLTFAVARIEKTASASGASFILFESLSKRPADRQAFPSNRQFMAPKPLFVKDGNRPNHELIEQGDSERDFAVCWAVYHALLNQFGANGPKAAYLDL